MHFKIAFCIFWHKYWLLPLILKKKDVAFYEGNIKSKVLLNKVTSSKADTHLKRTLLLKFVRFKVTKKAKFWWKSKDWRKSIFSYQKENYLNACGLIKIFFSLRDFVHLGYCNPWQRRWSLFVCVTNYVPTQNLRTFVGIDLLLFFVVAYHYGEVQSEKSLWKRCEKRCEIAKKGMKEPMQTIFILVAFK